MSEHVVHRHLWLRSALVACMLLVAGCAPYRIPQAIGPAGEPGASWSIRAGDPLKEREICNSESDRPCVIRASSAERPASVVLSVYLRPVGDAKTTYQGALRASVLSSNSADYERQVDVTIEPARRPTGISVAGTVSSTPGPHYFRMLLLATVPTHTDPYQFDETIPIEVVASDTGETSRVANLRFF
jgi:hypothetical protein